MTRILLTLASLSITLLLLNTGIGLSVGDLEATPRTDLTQTLWRWHFLLGLAAALTVVLVESIVVTYFIGTSRWCREVVETYRLDPSAVRESNRLKRRTFPWSVLGMLTVILIIALGAAADPGTGPNTEGWAEWHLIGAIVGTAFIAWTYVVAWNNVVAHYAIIQRLVAEVAHIRRDRGLEQTGPIEPFIPAKAGPPA
jgi:hypothetical protein